MRANYEETFYGTYGADLDDDKLISSGHIIPGGSQPRILRQASQEVAIFLEDLPAPTLA